MNVRTNLYVLRSTGNAYDVINHRRLSGPRAPPPIFWTSLHLCLTPSTTTYYLKDCLPGSVLLTRFSTGFSPIFLLALSPSKHRKHHPNHALSPVVFRKVQFWGPYFLSSTLLHSAISSKPTQSTIIYTLMTPNY